MNNICPIHNKPLKASRFDKGGWYCPEKVDGKWCTYKLDAQGNVIVPQSGNTPVQPQSPYHEAPRASGVESQVINALNNINNTLQIIADQIKQQKIDQGAYEPDLSQIH